MLVEHVGEMAKGRIERGADAVGTLAPGGASEHSVAVTAPANAVTVREEEE